MMLILCVVESPGYLKLYGIVLLFDLRKFTTFIAYVYFEVHWYYLFYGEPCIELSPYSQG